MDSHPDFKTDLTYSLPDSAPRQRQKLSQCTTVSLETVLQQCLSDSLKLQQSILRRFGPPGDDIPAAPHTQLPPMASSTPYSRVPPDQVPLQGMTTDNVSLRNVTCSPQANSADVSNTSRILASVLYHSRLEPPVFA